MCRRANLELDLMCTSEEHASRFGRRHLPNSRAGEANALRVFMFTLDVSVQVVHPQRIITRLCRFPTEISALGFGFTA